RWRHTSEPRPHSRQRTPAYGATLTEPSQFNRHARRPRSPRGTRLRRFASRRLALSPKGRDSLSPFGGSATEISARRAQQPTTAAWSNLSKLVSIATRSLFLDDHGALFGLCDCVGCGLSLLPAGVVFGLAFAVVDVPDVVFLIDPDR